MNSVFDHYKDHLATHYSWMYGSYNARVDAFIKYFLEKKIMPFENKLCVDLGCGSGFQTIALAQIGFEVKAIDFCSTLLHELDGKKGNFKIETVEEDILNFSAHLNEKPGLIICMGDTLTHLKSTEAVSELIKKTAESLVPGGKFILSYRDMSMPLKGKERFIPVRSEDEKIFMCFLEYFNDHVEVFDVIHTKEGEKWSQQISSYKKLILSVEWVREQLAEVDLKLLEEDVVEGLNYIIAEK